MKKVISKDVALVELEGFINRFVKKPVPVSEMGDAYPDILEGIMDGYVSFGSDGIPVYKLKFPIKNDAGEDSVTEINFRTRIKPTALADIAKGLHPQKEVFMLQLRMTAFIIDQPVVLLDKLEAYDYDAISQISGVFS